MGEVYVAQDRTLGRNVALKILPPDVTRNAECVRRFVLEARSASSLNHPSIVTIYEIGQGAVRSAGTPDSEEVHFISMELVNGRTLAALIHEEKTDLRTLLGYLAQAADGLAKAHAAGIVHRDLKPGNIMVSADGLAKVLDFGLAKLMEQRDGGSVSSQAPTQCAEASAEGVVVGTVGYMSPEQVQGMNVDHRSDIFSLGCILYEAATRVHPLATEAAGETLNQIRHATPVLVEGLNAGVPAELRRLIRRCLAKSAEQRVQSMKDVALELREIADEYEKLSASATSGRGATVAAARSGPAWVRVLLSVGATVVLLVFVGRDLLRPLLWHLRTQPYQAMRMNTVTSSGDVLDCAISPDGRYVAYMVSTGDKTSLRVRQVATGSDVEVLPPAGPRIGNPAFSPDGNYVFYRAPGPDKPWPWAIYEVPSLGGTPRERVLDVDSRVTFSPDGRQIAFWRRELNRDEYRLIKLDLDAGREKIMDTLAGGDSFNGGPSWSPDGRRIAAVVFTRASRFSASLVSFDTAGGRRTTLVKVPGNLVEDVAWTRDGKALVTAEPRWGDPFGTQLRLHEIPGGADSPITNDFNAYHNPTVTRVGETIAAQRVVPVLNVWLADVSGAPARQLTFANSPEKSAKWLATVDTSTVLFDALDAGTMGVWAVETSSGQLRKLTASGSNAAYPFAAGGVVVFNQLGGESFHVGRMSADGSNVRQLTAGSGERTLAISSDGRHALVTHREFPQRVSIISTDDGQVVLERSEVANWIGFSPDGRSVLLAATVRHSGVVSGIYWSVYPLTGGPPTGRYWLPPSAVGARWAPDGMGVTFLNYADAARNVFRMPFSTASPYAGGTPIAVTKFTRGLVAAHEWSPDGRWLAVRLDEGSKSSLWVVDAAGGHPRQLAGFASEAIPSFRWMADSRRIAFLSGTLNTDLVLIQDFR